MAFGDLYSAGTASLDGESPADLRKVIGHGTLWSVVLLKGDSFERAGVRVTIGEVVSDTELTLAYEWPGDQFDEAEYVVRMESGLRHAPTEMTSRVRDLLERLQIFDSAAPIYTIKKYAVTEPPIDGVVGDYGVVASSGATGSFTGKENQIYLIQETGYAFFVPNPGWQVFDSENLIGYYWTGDEWLRPVSPYHLPVWVAGSPPEGEIIWQMSVPQVTRFLQDLPNSIGRAVTPATNNAEFSVRKNGVQFATVTFSAGNPVPAFACPTTTVLSPGDVLDIVAPAVRDPSLANANFTLVGKL